MKHILSIGTVLVVTAFVAIILTRGPREGFATASHSAASSQAMGSAIPPPETQFLMAVLVNVEGAPNLPEDALLYVSRATFNRLREEAGVDKSCDREGLMIRVKCGDSSAAWGLLPGSTVAIAVARTGVPVPSTVVAGDAWFSNGIEQIGPPCN